MPIQLVGHCVKRFSEYAGNWPYNSRPIPMRCEPCPGNTATVFPTDAARPITTPGAGSPLATLSNPAINA